MATHFQLSMEGVIHALQALLILGPIFAYIDQADLSGASEEGSLDRPARLRVGSHRSPAGRRVRWRCTSPLDSYESWQLVSYTDYAPLMLRPNDDGRIPFSKRLRAGFSRWFFEDRIVPPPRVRSRMDTTEDTSSPTRKRALQVFLWGPFTYAARLQPIDGGGSRDSHNDAQSR